MVNGEGARMVSEGSKGRDISKNEPVEGGKVSERKQQQH